MLKSTLLAAFLISGADPGPRSAMVEEAGDFARKIDAAIEQRWSDLALIPAEDCDDATFLRRLSLDLVGRIPTVHEARDFLAESPLDKRKTAVTQLMAGPEFPLHWGNVLDEFIQQRHAGDERFVAYLRDSITVRKPWDRLFREIMLGPWDSDDSRRADRFLQRRIRSVDEMATDTARVFFGVDISCAKCHDHPLVEDWKQDHYYGMSSFFNRTYQFKAKDEKEKRSDGQVAERSDGDLKFVDQGGENRTARMMFLTGAAIDEADSELDSDYKERREQAKRDGVYLPPPFSRREQLVSAALAERQFFCRAVVNRVWANLMGRGMVHPVEQMHSRNASSVPGLLELLADDFAEHGYSLDRLIAAIVLSRPYQLASAGQGDTPPEHFAVAALRPLSPLQYAMSVQLATGEQSECDCVGTTTEIAERFRNLEQRGQAAAGSMDPRGDNFQSSVVEALFMSNNPDIQTLFHGGGTNLVSRLADLKSVEQIVETAIWTIHGRPPEAEEREQLVKWIEQRGADQREEACGSLVWALVTSAEFRFNH